MAFDQVNLKVNELLYRRVDLADAARGMPAGCKVQGAGGSGSGRFVVSATTPFLARRCGRNWAERGGTPVIRARFPAEWRPIYAAPADGELPATLDRVYDNAHARRAFWAGCPSGELRVGTCGACDRGDRPFSALAYDTVGASKGYHGETFEDGPFPVEEDA